MRSEAIMVFSPQLQRSSLTATIFTKKKKKLVLAADGKQG